MKKEKKTVSFAQKYGLQGLGKPVKISEGTKEAISSLDRSIQDINKKGEEYSKLEKRLFGGCPRPGEPGSEKFFKVL